VSETPKSIAATYGTRDVIPPESAAFEQLVAVFAEFARRYGFGLVVSPMFEEVGVFKRGIGEDSDVTKKEMYVFEDRGGRQLALRPEGTASVVRAFVQHHPTTPWKVWYATPAFRYERPQAGRYRQHHQVGVEVLGTDDPVLDVEVIALAWRYYEALGLREIELRLNSMGHAACRAPYVELLSNYLAEHANELCDEHCLTWQRSPLRVLDCKREPCRRVTVAGPLLIDHLCDDCRAHFAVVTSGLDAVKVPWSLDARLVRGFDYYTRTTFEFAAHALDAAQNAVGGGGRYDQLAEQLGGPPTSGIGFGSGIERILLALEAEGVEVATGSRVDVFVVDTTGSLAGLTLVEQLRVAGVACDRGYDGRSMKSQMKLADRSGARVALLLGSQEIEAGTVTMRDLRGAATGERQRSVALADVVLEVQRVLLNEMM
jgi:histidyl-tRNA synthetase